MGLPSPLTDEGPFSEVPHLQSLEVKFRLVFFGFKSWVFLAVCGQILQKFSDTYDLRSS